MSTNIKKKKKIAKYKENKLITFVKRRDYKNDIVLLFFFVYYAMYYALCT